MKRPWLNGYPFHGTFLELVPNKIIKYQDQFEDPNLPGVILVTIKLTESLFGTEVDISQDNIPSVVPKEMCYLGWQESLKKLGRLVEPEIKE